MIPSNLDFVDGSRRLSFKELAALPAPVGDERRIFPIAHSYLVDRVFDGIEKEGLLLRDAVYTVSHGDARLFGLFELVSTSVNDSEQSWIIAVTNANDGTDGISIYGGTLIHAPQVIIFHEELSVIKRHSEESLVALDESVAAAIKKLHEHWNVNHDRSIAYKQLSLTPEKADHFIADAIWSEVVAGREIASLLSIYRKPIPYLKPRTLWSLYSCIGVILNKLKPPQLIDRTIKLTSYFDHLASFKLKPSKYTQTYFA